MKNFYTYIIFGVFVFSGFAMGNQKGKAMGHAGSQITSPVDLIIIDDSNDNEVERRRGHKRKRKIRPKRNGF
tara:strand:- start:6260 stop:6475 length:216 start_codon:yes stop_codon:yes gene_type:complete